MSRLPDVPGPIHIETFFMDEIQHVKDHVHLRFTLCFASLDKLRAEQLAEMPNWQRLIRSREGQFQILFGSLERLEPQLGDDTHRTLVTLAKEAESFLLADNRDAALSKLEEMAYTGWSKRSRKAREPKQ